MLILSLEGLFAGNSKIQVLTKSLNFTTEKRYNTIKFDRINYLRRLKNQQYPRFLAGFCSVIQENITDAGG